MPFTRRSRQQTGDRALFDLSTTDDPRISRTYDVESLELDCPPSVPCSSRVYTSAALQPAAGGDQSTEGDAPLIRILLLGPDSASLLGLFEADRQHYEINHLLGAPEDGLDSALEDCDLVCMLAGEFARAFLACTDNRRRTCRILLCVREMESDDNLELVATYRGVHIISQETPPDDLLTYLANIAFPRQLPRLSALGFVVDIAAGEQYTNALPLIDISNSGCAFAMPMGSLATRILPGRVIRSIRIRHGDEVVLQDAEAITRHVQLLPSHCTTSPQYRVGVSFTPRQLIELGSMDSRIGEPQRIRAILIDRRSIASMVLRRLDDDPAENRPSRLEVNLRDCCLTATFESNCILKRGDVARGIFEMAGDSFSFITSVLEVSQPQPHISVLLGFPRMLRVSKRRRAVRFRPRCDHPVYVDIASPFTHRTETRPVLDLTTQGLCFSIQEADVFPIGTLLSSFALRFPDNSEVRCNGRVRSLSQMGTGLRCGVELEPTSTLAQDRLADAIVHAGQPDIRDVRSASLDDVWTFLERSGFIYPEKRQGLQIDAVKNTMGRLMAQPNDVFKGTLFVRGSTIHAHISAVRIYERTWMLQHLAARASGKQPISFARLINLALLEYLEQKSDIEWIRVTYRPENRAPSRLFRALAARVSQPELSRVRVMNCMRWSTGSVGLPESRRGISVRPATLDDIASIESYMLTHRNTFASQQEDLQHHELHLEGIAERYRRIGLERRREILVVTQDGAFAGFALLEVSSPGLNLSELTNAFRVFLLDGTDDDVTRALIDAARMRYMDLGRSHAIAMVDDTLVPMFASLGFEQFKRYALWTWHRSLYRQFHDYLLGEVR